MNNNNNDKKTQSREEDEAAIRRIINGDKEAYFILQKKYKSIIASHIRKLINDEDDIDDLTQETFIKAYKAIETFNFNYAFYAWLCKIASNTCIDFLRKKRYHTISLNQPLDNNNPDYFLEIEDNTTLPDLDIISIEQHTILHKAIESLPKKYSTIIKLRHIDELEYSEIAEKLNLPLGTVKVNIFRARKMLQIELRKYASLFDLDKTND
ncbi:MAG: sigma-70 family RNA polymerase sigma factor [Bacteroidetes bacterium]|nr:sigma-70 family RNA polymerase sigma factor [Bacteroidota bacterium]